jgi:putative spermidine/putrescine transport system ATP-binding protein
MSEALEIKNISKRFGAVVALEDVNLSLPPGKLVCFLGPSGCGKTTLLRLIAGLETPTSGSIYLGDKDLTKIPAHKRDIGMVFQSFALFPHLNVAENIAYGLRIRGVDKSVRLKRADELLELVKLAGLDKRHISQLSGGQKQRVAMARALALEPDLFLLDEPLSALDAKLREAMQVELKLLQQRVGLTTIIVTHDQQEAMTMADVIVVMGDNRVQQIGEPLEIYHKPKNRFVADFIGTNNFLEAMVVDGGHVKVREQVLLVNVPKNFKIGQAVTLSIRPERLKLSSSESADNALTGNVTFVRDLGASVETFVDSGGQTLRVIGAAHQAIGTKVWLSFPQDCVVLSSEAVSA